MNCWMAAGIGMPPESRGRRRRYNSVTLGLEVPEGGHEVLGARRGDVLDRQGSCQALGHSHLLEVGETVLAEAQVVHKRAALVRPDDALEVVKNNSLDPITG